MEYTLILLIVGAFTVFLLAIKFLPKPDKDGKKSRFKGFGGGGSGGI